MAELSEKEKNEAKEIALTNYMATKGLSARGKTGTTVSAKSCSGCFDICDCKDGGLAGTGAGIGGAAAGAWSV